MPHAGWVGIGPEEGTFVADADAYSYAMERCLHGTEEDMNDFREMLVEWYFSGNWINVEE